jgi:D-xylose transport system substrate-binding protein
VICYDRLITGCDVDLYLSFDNVRVGRLQAEYLIRRLGGRGRIVRIHGPKTDRTGMLFKQGQDEVLGPSIASGAIRVVHEDYATGWRPDEAKRIVNAAITASGPEIDAVLAPNDGTAGGAIQALIEEGLAGKVLVTGQDADLAACQRIVRGSQAMSVYKPLARLADRAAEVAVALGRRLPIIARDGVPNGVKEVPSILEDVVVVDRDNLDQTVVRDGFHRAEQLR